MKINSKMMQNFIYLLVVIYSYDYINDSKISFYIVV